MDAGQRSVGSAKRHCPFFCCLWSRLLVSGILQTVEYSDFVRMLFGCQMFRGLNTFVERLLCTCSSMNLLAMLLVLQTQPLRIDLWGLTSLGIGTTYGYFADIDVTVRTHKVALQANVTNHYSKYLQFWIWLPVKHDSRS